MIMQQRNWQEATGRCQIHLSFGKLRNCVKTVGGEAQSQAKHVTDVKSVLAPGKAKKENNIGHYENACFIIPARKQDFVS